MRIVRLDWARSMRALAAATSRRVTAGWPLVIAATVPSYSLPAFEPGSHEENGSRNRSTAAEKTTSPAYADVWLPIRNGTAWLPQRCRAYAAAVPSATSRKEIATVPGPALLDATAAASMVPAHAGTACPSECGGASAPAGGPWTGAPCGTTIGGTTLGAVARPTAT